MIRYIVNRKGLVENSFWEPNCWINVENPTDSERDYLLDELKIPSAFYNDIEDIDERPRVELEKKWHLIIIRLPIKQLDSSLPFSTIPLGIIFKDDIFITISFHKTDLLSDFILYTQRKKINYIDNIDLVFRLLLSSSVWFLKYLKQINQQIRVAENQLEKSIKNEDLQTLLKLEKCLVFFTTSLKGNDILIRKLRNIKSLSQSLDEELLEDVVIELRQAQDMTNIYSNILSGMMDAYASVISNNLNVIMKLLTSISIILMIPTVIASFYGMNVPNSFENNPFGFWIVFLLSFVISFIGVMIFRFKKWF